MWWVVHSRMTIVCCYWSIDDQPTCLLFSYITCFIHCIVHPLFVHMFLHSPVYLPNIHAILPVRHINIFKQTYSFGVVTINPTKNITVPLVAPPKPILTQLEPPDGSERNFHFAALEARIAWHQIRINSCCDRAARTFLVVETRGGQHSGQPACDRPAKFHSKFIPEKGWERKTILSYWVSNLFRGGAGNHVMNVRKGYGWVGMCGVECCLWPGFVEVSKP